MYKGLKIEGKITFSNKKTEFCKIVTSYLLVYMLIYALQYLFTYLYLSVSLHELLPWDIMYIKPIFETKLAFSCFFEVLKFMFYFSLVSTCVEERSGNPFLSKNFIISSFCLGTISFIITVLPLSIYNELKYCDWIYENNTIKMIIMIAIVVLYISSIFLYFVVPLNILEKEKNILKNILKSFKLVISNVSEIVGLVFSFLHWFILIEAIQLLKGIAMVLLENVCLPTTIHLLGDFIIVAIGTASFGVIYYFYPLYYCCKTFLFKKIQAYKNNIK